MSFIKLEFLVFDGGILQGTFFCEASPVMLTPTVLAHRLVETRLGL
jgi:hypothetical protein